MQYPEVVESVYSQKDYNTAKSNQTNPMVGVARGANPYYLRNEENYL